MGLYVKLSNVMTKLAGLSPAGSIVKNSSNVQIPETKFIDTKSDLEATALGDSLKTVIPSAYATKELLQTLNNLFEVGSVPRQTLNWVYHQPSQKYYVDLSEITVGDNRKIGIIVKLKGGFLDYETQCIVFDGKLSIRLWSSNNSAVLNDNNLIYIVI